MYGFSSISDFINTFFFKYFSPKLIAIIFGLLAFFRFIFQNAFHNEFAIYFLIILYCIDFLTGVLKAYIRKELVSKKIPRVVLTLFGALLILSITFFSSKFSIIFEPVGMIFYSIFLAQQILSVGENLHQMGAINIEIWMAIKDKFNIKNIGKNKN